MTTDPTSLNSCVLILGGRGRLGFATATAFAQAGWRVICHLRPGAQPVADSHPSIQWLSHNLGDTVGLAQAARGAQVVVHALNPVYTNRQWRRDAPAMLGQSLEITRALGATLMLPGNIYNFGADMPALLSEDTPQQAQTVKGQIRMSMEQQMQASGVRCVVIRAGDFFGGGHGSWFDQTIAKDLRKGAMTYPGDSNTPTAWAYLPDLARTFVLVAQRRAALGRFEVFHFAGNSLTGQQWLAAMTPVAQARGWVAPGASLQYKTLPWAIIRIGAWFHPVWASLMEMQYLWKTPHALDNRKLVKLIGAEPHTPLVQAARQALQALDATAVGA